MSQDLINEFSRMLPESRLDRKEQLIKETTIVNRLIDDVDHLIEIYSGLDFVRVSELMTTRASYMNTLLELLSESNDLYLGSIASNDEVA